MATLSVPTVYSLARGAGFPPETARKMVAIAQRESSLNPGVYGDINKAAETSYGLWQINYKDAGIRRLLNANGITAPEMLYDPATNAKAAFLLWGGSDRNLELAWYINRMGNQYRYGEKYAANLAALPDVMTLEVMAGLAAPAGPGDGVAPGDSFAPDFSAVDEFLTSFDQGDGNNVGLLVAAGLAIAAAAVLA